jgi:hypothetical protein
LLYPPDAVIVIVEFATFAVVPRVKFNVTLPPPGAFILFALQLPVIPVGKAEFETVIAELNPANAVVVTVKLPFAPGARVTVDGLTARVNPATFTVTGAVRVTPPPIAVMVSV